MNRLLIGMILLIGWGSAAFCAPAGIVSPEGKTMDSAPKTLGGEHLSGKALDGKPLQEMFGGLVTNQTITVAGADFYRAFSAAWSDKPMHERYLISVRERPSARWGNEVWVDYAERRVFQAALPPNRSNIKSFAEQAAEMVYKNVADIEVQRLLFRDPDVAADEF